MITDGFRDSDIAKDLVKKIERLTISRKVNLMEVCGTHTVSIFRHGIRSLLPDCVNLLSGPGCPVCVTSIADIDRLIAYSKLDNVIIATFGDMLRVPGSSSSLIAEKSNGKNIEVVYSTEDAVDLARKHTDKSIIFAGIGFETTIPTVAHSIKFAHDNNIDNYFVYALHKLVPPALELLLSDDSSQIDGFILPGHVSVITGSVIYVPISDKYNIPMVIGGFEGVDILMTVLKLLQQIERGKAKVENTYQRAVTVYGNPVAKELMNDVYEPATANWRGIGTITSSGLKIKEEYGKHDAEKQFEVDVEPVKEDQRCICGLILKGLKTPLDCQLFSTVCNPEIPYGACMVSSEGTCSAYYKYGAYDV